MAGDLPTIVINMDATCRQCGKKEGTAENGLCLKCITKGLQHMDGDQLTLTTEWVELTTEEQIQKGHELADALRELRLMEEEHTARKKEMKDQATALEQHIALVAQIVRTGKEERPITHERAG